MSACPNCRRLRRELDAVIHMREALHSALENVVKQRDHYREGLELIHRKAVDYRAKLARRKRGGKS